MHVRAFLSPASPDSDAKGSEREKGAMQFTYSLIPYSKRHYPDILLNPPPTLNSRLFRILIFSRKDDLAS